ncbi:MAG TPA: radical SAM protein [Deltaproteobacteria bacterium]|nr:radical SAM protein [Deltaproteobacteria bacterium]
MIDNSNKNTGTHALLLQPPPGDLTGPYPALCYLKSYAAAKNYRVTVRDLGIEAFHYLSGTKQVQHLADRAAELRKKLETKGFLAPAEQQHYHLLLMAMGIGLNTGLQDQVLGCFKNRNKFYDYRLYKKACRVLGSFFRLLSAVHYPTIVTPSEYPTATMLKTMKKVLDHRKRCVNPYTHFYEDVLLPQIAAEKPPVIGISMVFASQSVQALVLGNLLKESFPDIHITLGGAYLSQWVMVMGETQITELFHCTDSVICGEGETSFVTLLEQIANGESLSGIPNLIHHNPNTGAFQRFDELIYTDVSAQPPPDFTDLELSAYLTPETVIPYSISRGCYWGKCVFCQNRYGDYQMRRYQTVPVDKAIAEMTRLSEQYQTDHFNFSNDVIDPAYLKQFSRAVIDSGKTFIWNTDLRAEKAFTKGECRMMAKAGLNTVAVGFESGCQKTLDAMDKGNRVETTREVLKNLYESGIATQVMGIFGFPGETEKDGEETVRFLEENMDRISYYVMGLLMVMPGSRMHDNPLSHGVTSISYANNPLKTPEPVWTSNTRMTVNAVHRLYQRLCLMENFYAINEYPYVGGLSTNHGFLYFRLGPDILKRLREEENQRHYKLHEMLGMDRLHRKTQTIKSVVPSFAFPYTVCRSPYPVEKIPMEPEGPSGKLQLSKGSERDYLIDPVNVPIQIGGLEIRLLSRINGLRNMKSILKKIAPDPQKKALYFVMYLLASGLVEVAD